ncbi:MAG: VanZ family protein [Cellulosilyticaceae bacterium]
MKKIWQFKLTIVVTVLVLIGMFMPGDDIPSVGIPHMDKVVHFGMFFCMAAAFYLEYVRAYLKKPVWWMILLVLLGFAIGTELVQGMTDSRSCDVFDGIVDMLGAITSVGVSTVTGNWYFRRQSR